MAITAKFEADFSDFHKETQKATAGLADFEDSVASTGSAFGKLDIERLLTSPMSSAKEAVLDVADGLPLMGTAAITAAVGVGLLAKEAWEFIQATADIGDTLGDLADKTGMSVSAVSRLSNAAQVAGTDVTTLSNIVFTLTQRMTTQSETFAAGLTKIGLSFEDIERMDPDQRLMAIATALNAQVDPLTRVAAGTDLMGKGYREAAAVLADLPEAMLAVQDIQPWTTEQAAAAEHFNQRLASMWVHLKAIGEGIARETIPRITQLIDQIKKIPSVQDVGALWGWMKAGADYAGAAIDLFTGQVGGAMPAVAGLSGVTRDLTTAVTNLKPPMVDIAAAQRADVELKKQMAKEADAAAAAQKKLADALKAMELAAIKEQGDALGVVLDRIFGTAALKKATTWTDAMNTFGVSVQNLRLNELEELEKTMLAGIDALTRSGNLTSQQSSEFARLAIEARAVIDAMQPVVTVTEDLAKAQWDYVTAQDAALAASIKLRDEATKTTAAQGGGGLLPSAIVGTGGVARDMFGRPVVPGGAISGLPVVNPMIININSPLGTPDAIARAVGDAVTGSYSSGGKRLPV